MVFCFEEEDSMSSAEEQLNRLSDDPPAIAGGTDLNAGKDARAPAGCLRFDLLQSPRINN